MVRILNPRFGITFWLFLATSPAVAQHAPSDAAVALFEHVYRDQESERLRAASLFGDATVPRAIVIVIRLESVQRHMNLNIGAVEILVTELNRRRVPTRWCQLSCPSVGGDRRVSIMRVITSTSDEIILEIAISGDSWAPGPGTFKGWVRKDLVRMRRVEGSWSVVEDYPTYIGDLL